MCYFGCVPHKPLRMLSDVRPPLPALLRVRAPVLSSMCCEVWRCFLQGVSATEMCLGPVWVEERVLLGSQK